MVLDFAAAVKNIAEDDRHHSIHDNQKSNSKCKKYSVKEMKKAINNCFSYEEKISFVKYTEVCKLP